MATVKFNRNLLPLLAFTVLLLSVGIINYNDSLVMNSVSTQSVLSESDERDTDNENEPKEAKRVEVKREEENKKIETKRVEKREEKKATEKPKVRLEIVESEDTNDLELDDETETEMEQETESVGANGETNKFKLKIKSRIVDGKSVVETASGEVEVENSPEDTINNLVDDEILDTPISFEAKTNDDGVEFEIQGVEERKLFGIFNLDLPKSVTVNSETGKVVSTKQNTWTKFLKLFSI